MDALTSDLHELLKRHGASDYTAAKFSQRWSEAGESAIERDQLEAKAQMLLPLGPMVAAERMGVCESMVYYLVNRQRTKSKLFAQRWTATG